MSTATVLIIDSSGDCQLSAAQTLAPEGVAVLSASDLSQGRRLLAAGRPDLVLADCRVTPDPLYWVEQTHHLGLAAQVIAVTPTPDFEQAMEWVAGGIYNVLTLPLDSQRLHRLTVSALETQALYRGLAGLDSESPSPIPIRTPDLAAFYRGLAGRLDGRALKSYLVDGVKKLTGARRVEMCLTEALTPPGHCPETHIFAEADPRPGLSPAPVSGQATVKSRLGFELSAEGRHLGEIYLYFDHKNDLRVDEGTVLPEVVAAASAALAGAADHHRAVNLAARDSLTGLYNRRIFDEVLEREFQKARRHNFSLSLLTLDLDHFKNVNDSHGHQVGDEVLKTVAGLLTRVARSTDLAARIGGEEFALVLPHTTEGQALVLARRIRSLLDETEFKFETARFRQTVSQGVAGLEHFMVKTPEDMVYWADQALYLAKREGRDAIRLASDIPMAPVMKDGTYAFQ